MLSRATYYVTDSYTHSAYYTTSLPDGYVVMDPTVASTATAATANDHPMNQTHHQPTPVQPTQLQQQPSQTISNNGLISHRDTIQVNYLFIHFFYYKIINNNNCYKSFINRF